MTQDALSAKLRWLAEQIQIIECQLATGPDRPACKPIGELAQYATELAEDIDSDGLQA